MEPIEIRNISEIFLPHEEVKYYIDGVIGESSRNAIVAKPGTGKTLALISMALSYVVPEIDNWLGFEVKEKGKVLFVQQEMPDGVWIEFLSEVYRGMLGWVPRGLPFDFAIHQKIDFTEEESVQRLMGTIIREGYKMVFVDSFAASFSGDENSKKDVQPALDRLVDLIELPSKPAIVFTHHTRRNDSSYRGSSAFEGALDMMMTMVGKGTNGLFFEQQKNRNRPEMEWEAKKLFSKDEDGNTVFQLEKTGVSDFGQKQKIMIQAIRCNPDFGQAELVETFVAAGGKRSEANGVLKSLDDSEVTEIVSESRGGKGKKKVRRLTQTYIDGSGRRAVANLVLKAKTGEIDDGFEF